MSLHPSSQSGTPIYTYGWSTMSGFPATEKGLSIYMWGWFGGQPDLSGSLDEVEFSCDIGRELVEEVSLGRELSKDLGIGRELVETEVGLGRELVETEVGIGRELTLEVER